MDIIEVEGGYKILEINNGVVLAFFSTISEENYKIAKGIYKDAVKEMFEAKI